VKYKELSTPDLKKKFLEEWERISDKLIRYQPMSNDAMQMLLKELLLMNEELERRNGNGNT